LYSERQNKELPVCSLMCAGIEKIKDYEKEPESRFHLCRLGSALARIGIVF
jgi:hypothetical protein